MKVMTVTEAKVVAFLTSMSVAPIAKPSPYNGRIHSNYCLNPNELQKEAVAEETKKKKQQ